MVLDPIKHASKTFLGKHVSREFMTMMLLWTLQISIQEKQTPHTNKEEVSSGFKTTACDVLSTI